MATLTAMFRLFDGYSSTIDKINRKTEQATDKLLAASGNTDKFNSRLQATGASANSASTGIGRLVGTLVSLAAIKAGMDITDNYTNTSARLALINDGLQTQAQLQDKIFAATERSRGSYTDMAGAISKMGILASDAFGSNDEIIRFTELLQKSFKVGGASGAEQSAGMYQLTQAMASGKLQGDEFRSIMENAPMLADAIAKFTGKSKGELKTMSAEGTITSDIIKNAMFAMSDDINAKFKTMPMTFADIWNKIKNGATRAFSGNMMKLSNLINSDDFNTSVTSIVGGLALIASGMLTVIDIASKVGAFIKNNWGMIEPIILGVVATLILYNATMGIAWLTTMKDVAAKGLHAIATWAQTGATFAQTVAQEGLNAALYACPLTWLISVIILFVVLIYVAVAAMNHFAGTSLSASGIIAGAFLFALAFVGNLFITLWNTVVGVGTTIWNIFATVAEFLANVFVDPIGSIIQMFSGMAQAVLGILGTIAVGIDGMFGSHLSDAVTGWQKGLQGATDKIAGEATIKVPRMDASQYALKGINFGDAWNTGYGSGSKLDGAIGSKLSSLTDSLTGKGTDLGTSSNPAAVQGTGSDGKVEVDMSDENIQYLRDIAERDYINKFSTATLAPNVTIQFGDVHEEADADKVVGRIKKILQEEIATASEGVYA